MINSIDPLDRDDFDPVQYINQRFPTESSLDDLDGFIADIGSQISTMDEGISKAVQTQSVVGKQASKDISEAQQSIEDLFDKIGDIKQKASQSETMVQEICADIKKLDNAKNHLQTSITALNRLQMLINAVNQLEMLAREYQYRDVANLLDAVKQFMSHFDKYLHIPVIGDIQKRVDTIKNYLTNHIRKTFRDLAKMVESVADVEVLLSTRADMPQGLRSLADACIVVDALGPIMRRQLLLEFVQTQLNAYDNSFSPGQEFAGLDSVDRRWAWCRRTLKYVDSKFSSIFPLHWRVPLRLCLEFVEHTKMHLIGVMTEMESKDCMEVNKTTRALQSALLFEKEMSTERFNLRAELQKSKASEEAAAKARVAEVQMQMKLKKDDKIMYIPTDHQAANFEDETESGFLGLANSQISGGISGIFDKFLGCYVAYERMTLEELLHKLSREEDSAAGNDTNDGSNSSSRSKHGNVFESSTSMFVFIKNAIKRCTQLTVGQTFLSLTKEFKTCMIQYVELLRNRCPTGIVQMGAASSGTAASSVYRLPPGMEVTVCHLLNTGEYCAEVVPQLEQMIQAKMTPSLAAKVDFSTEVDEFMDLVAFCLKKLVSGIMDRLESAFKMMQSMNWGSMDQVGEESTYLHTCNQVLLEAIPKIRESLAASYFNNFCTKLASEILQRYLDIIVRQKRLSEMATQQLLLDTYNVKTLLLQLHSLSSQTNNGGSSSSSLSNQQHQPSSMFTKLVSGKVAHIEMILKLVGTPEELLLERFRIMWPDGQPSDLQMLMSLKSTRKNDQQVILEMFGLSISGSTKAKWSGGGGTSSAVSSAASSGSSSGGGGAGSSMSSIAGSGTAAASAAASAASAAAAIATSSMKSLTQDLSSTARSAVTNLKWSTTK